MAPTELGVSGSLDGSALMLAEGGMAAEVSGFPCACFLGPFRPFLSLANGVNRFDLLPYSGLWSVGRRGPRSALGAVGAPVSASR